MTNLSSAIRPHWSKDGRWIYFRSYDIGKAGIYRCPASGGNATRLSDDNDANSPVESIDGATIYFVSHEWNSILKQVVPSAGGAGTIVEGMPVFRRSDLWALAQGSIYFVPADHPDTLFNFEMAIGKVKEIHKVDKEFGLGLSVSSDGRWIAFSEHGDLNSNIMFVDHLK